jgi:protein translocase SecG subunit
VLLQKGKGVGFAGAFGAGGGSDAVFGPRSSKSLPQRITYSMAGIFMLLALLMSMLSGNVGTSSAPALVDETGMSATDGIAGPATGLGALFSDEDTAATPAPEATTDAPAATDAATPVVEVNVDTPMPESTPAADAAAPVEDAAPAAEAPAVEAAPVDAPAPAAEAAPAEAPAAEAPADAPAAQ